VVARVTNVTAEPVSGVDVTFDVRNARNPEVFYRAQKLVNATLGPNESREVELGFGEPRFYIARFKNLQGEREWISPRDFGGHVGDRWFDVTLHVDYRDRHGFVRHIEQYLAIDA